MTKDTTVVSEIDDSTGLRVFKNKYDHAVIEEFDNSGRMIGIQIMEDEIDDVISTLMDLSVNHNDGER